MAIEKQKLILISGVVLGIVAILMTKIYLDQQKQEAEARAKKSLVKMQANQSVVLVAKHDIPSGSVIESSMIDSSIVPNQFIQPQVATSIDRVLGMISLAPISKGEQISLSKLSKGRRESAGSSLAGNTPAGKRAISIAVDSIASVSGMVMPGDYVDVIATLQVPIQGPDGQISSQVAVVPLFQNVLVLAVGQNTGSVGKTGSRYDEKETSSSGLITLALGPQEANLIAFVQEQGKMRLTLRSPADASVEQVVPASWETLFQYIMPQQKPVEVKEAPVVDTATEYVEVFRGLKKEKVSLSQ
ncbi:MAG: Flp pilus assembly protein CpaB [Candidatus Omnitrophica bacterium]|jgi:pilus assembly protein CpaB|nr:Flp pilus assembly protein CpaB [Candidatus Omnitrophota bacterium]MDD5690563.1 Flp pilus assembly protein CpaB [Candidatus Omnitrophota bacterium]